MNKQEQFPLVSIVLTTYNGEPFLRLQLESLVKQTYPSLEIIAVDDCSGDHTYEILQEYASLYPCFHVHRNEVNIGFIKNFERGIQLSNANYIALCDQDDIWHLDKIKILMENLTAQDSLIYCDSELIDDEGHSLNKKMSDVKKLGSYNDYFPFLIGNCISGHSAIIHRNLILKALPFPDWIIPHDWWLAFMAAATGGVKFINQPLVQYRQHSLNSIGAVKSEAQKKINPNQPQPIEWIRKRMQLFADCAEQNNLKDKEIILALNSAYKSFSLANDFKRMIIFLNYRSRITALKIRNDFRRWIFCIKMFVKII